MPPLFIYGCGGLGREILSLVKALPDWEVKGFYDDGVEKGTRVSGLPVFGGLEELKQKGRCNLVVAIGDPVVKARVVRSMEGLDVSFPVIIHPSAILQDRDRITVGAGSVIAAGCILTTDIRIGDHVLLNLNVTVGHDTAIGDCSSIMPGANLAGMVKTGPGVLVGSGASIINNLTIGARSKVGAGAVVIRDVPEGVTVVGVPAVLKKGH